MPQKSTIAPRFMLAAAFVAVLATTFGAIGNHQIAQKEVTMSTEAHSYAGLWVTDDGRIRHQLLPNGRYDEARGTRESAYQGQYWIEGNRIEYLDDTGFTADGEFRDDVLYHAGMVLRRR